MCIHSYDIKLDKNILKTQYDMLINVLEDSIELVKNTELKTRKKILFIGIGSKQRIEKALNILRIYAENSEIYFVAQANVVSSFKDKLGDINIIAVSGNYTEDMFAEIKEKYKLSDIDMFLYNCAVTIDLRNTNIFDIAGLMISKNTWCCVIDDKGDISRYKNINVVSRGINLYEAVNAFINEL